VRNSLFPNGNTCSCQPKISVEQLRLCSGLEFEVHGSDAPWGWLIAAANGLLADVPPDCGETPPGDKTAASNILLVLIAVACLDTLVRKSEFTGGFLGSAGGPGAGRRSS
jgi:hypothetical protein